MGGTLLSKRTKESLGILERRGGGWGGVKEVREERKRKKKRAQPHQTMAPSDVGFPRADLTLPYFLIRH